MSRPGYHIRADGVHLTSEEAMGDLIGRMASLPDAFRIPLFRAARAGALNVALAEAGEPVPARFLKMHKPRIVILSGDIPTDTGPAGWPQARKLLRWANGAIFHAAAGRAEDYAQIAALTTVLERFLLVEMELRHMDAWRALAQRTVPRLKVLRIQPPPGVPHPVPPGMAGMTMQ